MRKRILAAFSGVAVVVGAISVAQAAEVQTKKVESITLNFGSLFAPKQFDKSGDVYGVRANAKSVSGSGTNDVMVSRGSVPGAIVPGPCSSGWCDTPRSIAKNNFGWDFSFKGKGAVIGIVDTGVDLNHPDFAGRLLVGGCIVSSVNACATANDQAGGDSAIFPGPNATHGTHVAGIAAGTNTGLATKAKILPVKVCSSTANSCNGVNDGIAYAATHGADVINVSIGGSILSSGDISSLASSVHATAKGVLLVVSAGNAGFKNPSGGYLAGAALKDGVRGRMLVVGASTSGGDGGLGRPSDFGQQPSTRCEVHQSQSWCMRDFFVMAPGVNIWSTVGNGTVNTAASYGYLSGTSMAAPYVTGVAALVKGQNPALTADEVAQVILTTADDAGAPGHDPVFGAGIVDVTRALAPVSLAARPASVPVAGESAASFVGTKTNALLSKMSGPLTGALAQSTLLKNALIVDSFGRPYNVDLTKAIDNRALSLTNILTSDHFLEFSPFAVSLQGPLGLMQVSGLGIQSTTPSMISGMYQSSDKTDFQVRELLIDAQVADGVVMNLGYKVDDNGGLMNRYDANSSAAYRGLFVGASGVNSPYASLTNGGSFIGTTLQLADDLHFSMTQSMLTPESQRFTVNPYSMADQLIGRAPIVEQREATATVASLNWDAAKWAGVGFTASQTNERKGTLGGMTTGALALADSAKTTAVGVSARVGFGDGWVTTASYSEGITQLDLKPNSIVTSATDLRSRSYGVAVAKHGLFGHNDSLGLALSRPIQVYSGSANLTAATGLDLDTGMFSYGRENLSLATRTPETDVELGYVTTFLDGALALQTNAAYQMNLAGQQGTNALAVVSRAKINF